jgi:N-acetylglucosamine transport system substrate-binding protein
MARLKAIPFLLSVSLFGAGLAACSDSKTKPGDGATATPSETKAAASSPAADVYPENGLSKTQKVTLKAGLFESGMGREWFDYAVDTFQKKFPNVTIEVTSSPTIDTILNTKKKKQ